MPAMGIQWTNMGKHKKRVYGVREWVKREKVQALSLEVHELA